MSVFARDVGGRFKGSTPIMKLLAQVRAVVERAARAIPDPSDPPLDPWQVSQGQFNAHKHLVASEHGHVVQANEVLRVFRREWRMPSLSWQEFLRILFQPERDIKRVHERRSSAPARVLLPEQAVFALLAVLDWIRRSRDPARETLEPDEYNEALADMITAAGAHGATLIRRLPTANQIEAACGDWDAALKRAGLPPRAKSGHAARAASACPIRIAWAAYVGENWDEPSYRSLNDWMRDVRGIALEGKDGRPWQNYREAGRREARKLTIPYPHRRGVPKPHYSYIASRPERRRKLGPKDPIRLAEYDQQFAEIAASLD